MTIVWLAPAMVNAIMALPDIERRDLSSVRLVISGGEKMPIPLIERLRRVFPSAWFADAYGLTETVSGDTFLDRDSTSPSWAVWADRVSTSRSRSGRGRGLGAGR